MSNEIVKASGNVEMAPVMSTNEAIDRYTLISRIVREVLVEGQDYGTVPHTNGKMLFKTGAEKLCTVFGLHVQILKIEKVHEENYLEYTITVQLIDRNGSLGPQGLGVCNSKENKYAKKNWADVQNTCMKMAKKRAVSDAVLSATGASSFFDEEYDENTVDYAPQAPQAPRAPDPDLVKRGMAKYAERRKEAIALGLKLPDGKDWPELKPDFNDVQALASWCAQLLADIKAAKEKPQVAEAEIVEDSAEAPNETPRENGEYSRPVNGETVDRQSPALQATYERAKEGDKAEEDRIFGDDSQTIEAEVVAPPVAETPQEETKPATKLEAPKRTDKAAARAALLAMLHRHGIDTDENSMPELMNRVNSFRKNECGADEDVEFISEMKVSEITKLTTHLDSGAVERGQF